MGTTAIELVKRSMIIGRLTTMIATRSRSLLVELTVSKRDMRNNMSGIVVVGLLTNLCLQLS